MIVAVLSGLLGGLIAGMLGLGGGIVFVPAMVLFLHISQHQAEGTSLLAIVPVSLVGAYSHYRHGDVRLKEGIQFGLLALGGAAAGVALANLLSARALKDAFAALILYVAYRLLREGFLSQSR
jgi:uncharacterized membrane protein YfcA